MSSSVSMCSAGSQGRVFVFGMAVSYRLRARERAVLMSAACVLLFPPASRINVFTVPEMDLRPV
jgi:hypothetical protein